MNNRTRPLYLLAIMMLLASCTVRRESKSITIERRWPAENIREIKINEVDGSLTVEAGKPEEIVLLARIRSRGVPPNSSDPNQGYFKTELDDDTLRIGRQRRRHRVRFPHSFLPHNLFVSRSVRIDYALRVPSNIALELQTVNGKIITRGVSGETELQTVNGAIDLETPGTSEVRATTVNGSVRATFVDAFQGARLKTVNGRVTAILPGDASFFCELAQVNGDFEATFPVSIHSHPGSRRVSGEVNGGRYPLKIVTVNGSIDVDNGRAPRAEPPLSPAPQELPPPVPPQPAPPASPSTF